MIPAYYLDENDRKLVISIRETLAALHRNTINREASEDAVSGASPVYLIATGSGIPSGAGSDYHGELGAADVEVWRAAPEPGTSTGSGSEDSLDIEDAGTTVDVLNFSATPVPSSSYAIAMRDRFGSWYTTQTGGSVGISLVDFIFPFSSSLIMSGCTDLFDDDRGVCKFVPFLGNLAVELITADASVTQAGVMNDSGQRIAGDKTLYGRFLIGENTAGTLSQPQFLCDIDNDTSDIASLELSAVTSLGSATPGRFIIEVENNGSSVFLMTTSDNSAHLTSFGIGYGNTAHRVFGTNANAFELGANPFAGGIGVTGTDGNGNTYAGGLLTGTGTGPTTIDGGTWT